MAIENDPQEELRYIREVMERSTEFSAISGAGLMAVGVIGVVASIYASLTFEPSPEWTTFWCAVAACALVVSLVLTLRKAKRSGMSVSAGPGRKFALCLAPAIIGGAALTLGLFQHGLFELMPATWLLMYGAGFVAGGTYSVGNLPLFGGLFMLLGIASVLTTIPADVLMGIGFGVLHLVMGLIIYRRYGG